MSDRSSAWIFSEFFILLASDPTEQHKEWARKMWVLSCQFDFSNEQLGCNEALITLGLAHQEGDEVVYYP